MLICLNVRYRVILLQKAKVLKAVWEIEEFNQRSPIFTLEKQQFEEQFIQNTIFDPSGGVQVHLLFKSSIKQLEFSMETARMRFFI